MVSSHLRVRSRSVAEGTTRGGSAGARDGIHSVKRSHGSGLEAV